MDPRLQALHRQVEARVNEVARGRDWPCRQGCDACCRRLANPPRLVRAEWDLLRAGAALLDDACRGLVDARVRALPASGPAVCPLLGGDGACLVYASRPVACRAYGFYRERDRGLCCPEIEARARDREAVVWGNGETLDARLAELGPARDLREWWLDSPPR